MIDDMFVIDAVCHPYNHLPSNFADVEGGGAIAELAYALAADPPDPTYSMEREEYLTDWTVPELANLLFHESDTDVGIIHPLAISAFKDGYVSIEKAAEAIQDYPNRFIGAYACVDPLTGQQAIDSIGEQVDLLKPLGLKLYPTSWQGGKSVSWRMDDPKLIYPLYEKAAECGLKHVAIHKAVPIGPIPVGDAYNPSDLENAATDFPELNFEIVHGGLAFLEETAWLLARFGNISINMEIQNVIVERRPRTFAQILLGLMHVAGPSVLDRMFWGSGGALCHPRPAIELFAEFEFPQDLLDNAGLFIPIPQITKEQKAGMLAGNFARIHGLDLDQLKANVKGDEFDRDGGRPKDAWSTVDKSVLKERRLADEAANPVPA